MFGTKLPDVSAILSLVEEQPRRISASEVDSKPQMPLGGDGLQIFARVTGNQPRWFAIFAASRDKAYEDTPNWQSDRTRPRFQLIQEPLTTEHSTEGDQKIADVTFHTAVLDCANPVSIRSFCLKIPNQARVNPPEIHFLVSVPQTHTSNSHDATDGCLLSRRCYTADF